jgi:hypothetical protein
MPGRLAPALVIPGFLANVETVRDIDEEESTWTAFFAPVAQGPRR